MKKIMLVSLLLIVSALMLVGCSKAQPQPAPPSAVPAPVVTEPQPNPTTSENIIEITTSGFNPKTITIKVGDTVTFVNKDSAQHWPASNIHPTHQTYPGSDIKKCGTSEESTIFDAGCRSA